MSSFWGGTLRCGLWAFARTGPLTFRARLCDLYLRLLDVSERHSYHDCISFDCATRIWFSLPVGCLDRRHWVCELTARRSSPSELPYAYAYGGWSMLFSVRCIHCHIQDNRQATLPVCVLPVNGRRLGSRINRTVREGSSALKICTPQEQFEPTFKRSVCCGTAEGPPYSYSGLRVRREQVTAMMAFERRALSKRRLMREAMATRI